MSISSVSVAIERFTTFGDLLKYLRRRTGLTQRELSIAIGYSDTQISRLEQNERMPDMATLTARFLPALQLEDQPEVARLLLELAAAARREDAPAVGLPPYKGLCHFDEADADLFFGREVLTAALVDDLFSGLETDQRFLAVIGASGSGKSSVVRAGLIPALRWQQPSSNWPVSVITPSAHPLKSLACALSADSLPGQPAGKLEDDLLRHTQTLQQTMEEIRAAANARNALIIVDQFEELFTLCRSEAEQTAFIDNLCTSATLPGGAAIIVIVMRADFYVHCARFHQLRQMLSRRQVYIGPMMNEELRRAIEEPARNGHWEIQPGLTELLLHDVGADEGRLPEPGALPLLSHALHETWRRRRGRMLTLSGYTASGGVRGAITETAEAVFYDQLESERRTVARQIFLRLTELGGDTSTADTRRRVGLNELSFKLDDRQAVHEVLNILADARLVTIDQDTAEVAHEALIRAWPTLRNWLEEDRESLRLHRHLTEAAREWELGAHDPGGLYRGARLAQAQEWSSTHLEELNLLERSFLDASQSLIEQEAAQRETQRQRELEAARHLAETESAHAETQLKTNRRLRRQAFFLAVAFILAGALAIAAIAFGQRAIQAERLSVSRELAAAALNNLSIDPERSVLLALASLDKADTLEARNSLHQSLPELHLQHILPAHTGGAADVTFNPQGTRIASIGEDGTAKIWDAISGQLLITMTSGDGEPSSSIAFSPNGELLATAWGTRVIFWDAGSGEKLFSLAGQSVGTTVGYNLGVGQISFSPDGQYLAVANMDGVSKIWNLATHQEVLSIQSGIQPAKAIAYSPDGTLLATGGDEGLVKIWQVNTGAELFTLELGGVIHRLSFAPDGARLAAASEDGGVKVWDPSSAQELLSLPRQSGLYDIDFLAGGTLVTAGQDGTARVWDSATGQPLLSLVGHISTVVGVAGSPDGSRIATSGYDGTVRIWDATPGRELLTMLEHKAIVYDVAYHPAGDRIASISVDGTARLWDAHTGQSLLTLSQGNSPTDGLTGLAFSPNGEQFATGSVTGTLTLWDSQSGERLKTLTGHVNMVVGLAFSPDGLRLASASWDGTAKVWDLVTGRAITTFSGHQSQAKLVGIAFAPDGRQVFTSATDGFVRLWDAASGQELRNFSGEGKNIFGMALSPDGELLAMGNQDGLITVWDLQSGEKIHTLTGHAGLVLRLAFNQDGTLLASASFDRLARVWEVASGQELFGLYGNTGNVFGVSFSPDGQSLATAGADGTVRVYLIKIEDLVGLARSRVTRPLSPQECEKYLHGACP